MNTERFCNCHWNEWEGHEFYCPMAGNNQPGAVVRATIFRNAFVGDIEKWEAEVTLDQHGIGATWEVAPAYKGHPAVRETLVRLNSRLDYSFNAPDTVCSIRAKRNHFDYRDWTPEMEAEWSAWINKLEAGRIAAGFPKVG